MLYFIPNTKHIITAQQIKDATNIVTVKAIALCVLFLIPVNFSIVLFLTVLFFPIVGYLFCYCCYTIYQHCCYIVVMRQLKMRVPSFLYEGNFSFPL